MTNEQGGTNDSGEKLKLGLGCWEFDERDDAGKSELLGFGDILLEEEAEMGLKVDSIKGFCQ